MKPIQLGAVGRYEPVPTASDTAGAQGNPGVGVVSTPTMVLFMERTAFAAVERHLDPGEAMVGARLTVEHLAPAYPGIKVECVTSLAAIDGRRFTHRFEATQEGRLIMRGELTAVLVDLSRFSAPSRAP
ncbi:MAG: thioesterase [Alphaproteobacteria bacterium]|nr:thioesterase [Alphaproteobacteria bacterium]